jgi:hypothetical protein
MSLIFVIAYFRFETLLYKSILLPDEDIASSFLQCLRRRGNPQDFSQTSIQAMSLSGDIQLNTAMEILSLCTGIKNLSVISESEDFHNNVAPVLQTMDALPLKVLSLQIGTNITSSLISDLTFFSKLTHLELEEDGILRNLDLQYFPSLTHLSIWGIMDQKESTTASLMKRILSHPPLQALVIRVDYHRNFAAFLDRHMLYDRRIVLATWRVQLWDDLGRACMLFWELVDECINLPAPNHSPSILTIYNGEIH